MSPGVKGLLVGIIKIGSISYILSKGFKIIGKREFGDILGFSGFAMCGINIIKIIQFYMQMPPPTWLVKLGDFINGVINIFV